MKNNSYLIKLDLFISINCDYNYTASYIENVARNFTKKYPSYLIHKKNEDKIKAFLTDRVLFITIIFNRIIYNLYFERTHPSSSLHTMHLEEEDDRYDNP